MSGAVSTDDLVAWIRAFRDAVQQHRDELTALDAAIGDADHGSNMARGLDAVVAKLDAPPASAADLFKTVGMTLVSSVGGASGPLYGTFFLRMGPALAEGVDAGSLGAALRAGAEGVVARGKAEPGDKTMVDAQLPAVAAWDEAVAAGGDAATAAAAAAAAATSGRDATEPLVARKGRASYLGERSAGHVDPGSASTALLFQTLSDTLAARG
ncbi:MAG: dihydroxyacetone kinase subunit L [Microbacterium sp. 71-36]|uniref:dihydroxyacetone kinase subunit DhaL n=1 Tax=unclassified Microbacterium TaxID=2609290 RepID=UPI00086F3BF2|nr:MULTISPECIES: dihydroxyacetone kinase subunit DhaL [unclassified Microbacterium]MBN9211877.1 dihydroxyacetone kinase subunit L [Microbacterium sp.]ODT37813.1 MAG: dihydroxyacetone kinase subunit L [Microbacterium sp. SCN 71-17]OJV76297.1 MAG: dihydroxyacetone kinase subunit L [Microbacterium sp. 71-36]